MKQNIKQNYQRPQSTEYAYQPNPFLLTGSFSNEMIGDENDCTGYFTEY